MKNRKAFTIVELIIVIAVIGVLAAILIPTFANIIKKANMAADKSAARNLNTYFAAEEKEDQALRNIDEALCLIADTEYAEHVRHPKTENYQFMWVAQFNRIALIDNQGELANRDNWIVVYPEEYARLDTTDMTAFLSTDNLFEINRVVQVNTGWITDNVGAIQAATAENPITVSVQSANELAAVAAMANRTTESYYSDFANVTISIASNISLEGTIWEPIGVSSAKPFLGSIEGNRHTIVGLTNAGYTIDAENIFTTFSTQSTGSAYGLIAYTAGDVTIKNLNMKNVAIDMVDKDNPADGNNGLCVGALVGYVQSNAANKLTITNCTVSGTVRGVNDIGGLVGKFYGKTIRMTNCTNNATVIAELSSKTVKGGGLVGYLGTNVEATTIENFFTNCKNNGSVTITSRNGWAVYSGGLFGGRSFHNGGIRINGFENNGTISAVSSVTGNNFVSAGQIAGQTVVGLNGCYVLEGSIVLNGSSTTIVSCPSNYVYDRCYNVTYGDDVLFGYTDFYQAYVIDYVDNHICYVAGATINGTTLTEASEWSTVAESANGTAYGPATYTFKLYTD